MELYDIAVIGGGINDTGIARDAAGRGLKVLLAEQGDFGSATLSASTNRIHGGRYERERACLIEHEWARTGEDVLCRRTKCGLHMSEARRRRVARRLADAR